MIGLLFGSIFEILLILGGLFLGWTIPQPQWAKDLQAWLAAQFAKAKTAVLAKLFK